MPFYKITVTDKTGRIMQGIRYDSIKDIDLFYGKAKQKAITTLKCNFSNIDVVRLSKYSQELKGGKDNAENRTLAHTPEAKGWNRRKSYIANGPDLGDRVQSQ